MSASTPATGGVSLEPLLLLAEKRRAEALAGVCEPRPQLPGGVAGQAGHKGGLPFLRWSALSSTPRWRREAECGQPFLSELRHQACQKTRCSPRLARAPCRHGS